MTTYTPSDISRTLDVPTSTIRRWARRFRHHLSDGAQRKNRLYNEHDLDVFSAVKELSARNLTLDEIERRLGDIVEHPMARTDRNTTAMTLPGLLRELEQVTGITDEHTVQLVELRSRLEQLEREAHLSLWQRIKRALSGK